MKAMTAIVRVKNWLLGTFLLYLLPIYVHAANETMTTGSLIINMGKTPQTIGNALKPYGCIYDLIQNYQVPIKIVIGQGKAKDGNDFIYKGIAYRGGTFIIQNEFLSSSVLSRITYWQGQGVDFDTTTTALTVNVTNTIKLPPRWTLDAANGSIAEEFLLNAGINNTAFPGAYNWKPVSQLDCCDDFFVMPHADPTWQTHNRLYSWNKDCLGAIWAGCHAASALENSINPADSSQQLNFLTTRTSATTPLPYPNNSLKLWTTHAGGSIPYVARLFDDPIAQYIGTTDLAQNNGSENIYIPKQASDPGGATRWRATTKIIAYDPSQANVPAPNINNGNVAATIVYGRAFGDNSRNYVIYESGHSLNKGTAADIPAQRAFFNFSFFQTIPKSPSLTFLGLTSGQIIQGGVAIPLSVTATSPLSGITFTYQWSSSCGGTFTNPTAASTTFVPPSVLSTTSCVVKCVVTDNCGRKAFVAIPITVNPTLQPPVAQNDLDYIQTGCYQLTASKTINVLANDYDPVGYNPLSVSAISVGSGGTWTTDGYTVIYTPTANFFGLASAQYTVCNTKSLCTSATLAVAVGTPYSHGCYPVTVWDVTQIDTAISQTNNSVGNAAGALNDDYDPADVTTYATFNAAADSLVLDFGTLKS